MHNRIETAAGMHALGQVDACNWLAGVGYRRVRECSDRSWGKRSTRRLVEPVEVSGTGAAIVLGPTRLCVHARSTGFVSINDVWLAAPSASHVEPSTAHYSGDGCPGRLRVRDRPATRRGFAMAFRPSDYDD